MEVFVQTGSGVRFIFRNVQYWFSNMGELKFQTGLPQGKGKASTTAVTEITIDLATGNQTDSKIAAMKPEESRFSGLHVPAYLEKIENRSDAPDDLAFAFLKHRKMKFNRPASWDGANVAFSADGKRFVLKMHSGELNRFFFLGDLDKDTLTKIESPPELREDNDLTMGWVSTSK